MILVRRLSPAEGKDILGAAIRVTREVSECLRDS